MQVVSGNQALFVNLIGSWCPRFSQINEEDENTAKVFENGEN